MCERVRCVCVRERLCVRQIHRKRETKRDKKRDKQIDKKRDRERETDTQNNKIRQTGGGGRLQAPARNSRRSSTICGFSSVSSLLMPDVCVFAF